MRGGFLQDYNQGCIYLLIVPHLESDQREGYKKTSSSIFQNNIGYLCCHISPFRRPAGFVIWSPLLPVFWLNLAEPCRGTVAISGLFVKAVRFRSELSKKIYIYLFTCCWRSARGFELLGWCPLVSWFDMNRLHTYRVICVEAREPRRSTPFLQPLLRLPICCSNNWDSECPLQLPNSSYSQMTIFQENHPSL